MVVLDGVCGCHAVAGTEPEASGEAASTLGVSGLEQVLPSKKGSFSGPTSCSVSLPQSLRLVFSDTCLP